MKRLIAENLVLLCWDDEQGKPQQRCASALAPGVGGALLLDALLAGAVVVEDERVRATEQAPADPLVGAVAAEASRGRRLPRVKRLVQRLGTPQRLKEVRDRLVDAGVLRVEQRKVLMIIPITRHPLADPAAATAVREAVRSLLRGQRDPAASDPREVLLAALAKPVNAIDVLVERSERKAAQERAESFGEGHGVPAAVGKAVQEAQTAAMAAITASIAAGSASSSSSR